MASISCDSKGNRRILFTDRDGERKAIHLGKVRHSTASSFKVKLETLIAACFTGTAIDAETARWLADLPDRMHERLVELNLAERRASQLVVTLGSLMERFFASIDVKPATQTRIKQGEKCLLRFFSVGRDVATITESDAEAWRAGMVKDGYAQATISRTVKHARQVLKWAMKRGIVARNPFADLKAGAQVNAARAMYVSRETIAKVLDAAPDAQWRLLIVLSRYGGLRVPSEALALRWSDVNWEHSRMTIRSSKTEHHEGQGERMIPIFPEIRGPLLEVFEEATAGGADQVITQYRDGCNLNPQFRRIIRRAGVTPWPRTWHNLRASRQTELAATFPLHTVCAWIGNTKAVAAGHYLQVTDADWKRATGGEFQVLSSDAQSDARTTQKPTQQSLAHSRARPARPLEDACFAGVSQGDASERDDTQQNPNAPGGT